MNNYWETNYKADQEGPTTFRYSIRPHKRQYHQIEAMRFGMERNRPLVVIAVQPDGPDSQQSFLSVDNPGVIITSVKPSRDGKATMVRLFAASGKPEQCALTSAESKTVYYSNPSESRGQRIEDSIDLVAYEIVSLRLE